MATKNAAPAVDATAPVDVNATATAPTATAPTVAADGVVSVATVPAAPAGLDGASVTVWGVVASDPGATVAKIAETTGLTRAVVKSELGSLEALGHLARTEGGKGANGRAMADTWAPVATPDEAGTDGTGDVGAGVSPDAIAEAMRIMQEEAERRAAAEAELRAAVAEEEARRAKVLAELAQRRTAEDTRRALADLLAAVTTTYAAVVAGDEAATEAGLERVFAETGNVRRASKAAPARSTTGNGGGTGRTGNGGHRAAPRPLRPEVIAHLNAYPDAEFTPGEIAKVLDRSSGAVANALDTLVKNGEAVLTNDRPARYRIAPRATTGAPADGATGGTGAGAAADAGASDSA
ncbi:MarR family transcriptional regulator [Actinomadura sp. 21ATH]|uniref:MarR family transcriptional regulator n=1 Tax=Actinomadura sp. 21ATH TaxID=1735444 RepID=UPI0035C2397E